MLLLAGLGWADHTGRLVYPGSDVQRFDGRAMRVVRVVDGDTLDVAANGRRSSVTRVRLWGVDTPETARPTEGRPAEAWAAEAAALTWELAQGQVVTLRLEAHQTRGRFGRLLAHVELEDGALLSERLLAEGLARTDERWSHEHFDRLADVQRRARQAKIGIWSKP